LKQKAQAAACFFLPSATEASRQRADAVDSAFSVELFTSSVTNVQFSAINLQFDPARNG